MCLVSERVPPLLSLYGGNGGGASSSSSSGSSSSSSSSMGRRNKSSGGDENDAPDDLSALDEFSSSSDSDPLPSIAGVVEVSLQGEKRELEALWEATGLFSNKDDSRGSENDGSGTGSGSSDGGLAGGLFSGWNFRASPLSDSSSSSCSSLTELGGFDESYAYVACMAVDERCRRSGAASALLAAAERAAGRWRQNWVLLHVHERNAGARALYASAGYAPLGPAERPGIVGAPRVLMGKQSGVPAGGGGGGALFSSSSGSSFSPSSSGITSIPSDLLGALKRDSEERAAEARVAKREKEEEREQRG